MFGQLAFLNDLRVINKLLLQDEVKSEILACYSEPILKKTYCFTLHWITKELACLYQNRADNKKSHRPSVQVNNFYKVLFDLFGCTKVTLILISLIALYRA